MSPKTMVIFAAVALLLVAAYKIDGKDKIPAPTYDMLSHDAEGVILKNPPVGYAWVFCPDGGVPSHVTYRLEKGFYVPYPYPAKKIAFYFQTAKEPFRTSEILTLNIDWKPPAPVPGAPSSGPAAPQGKEA